MRVNPSIPVNQRIQQSKTTDSPASNKPSIELLTDDSTTLRGNECRPGECAPMFGGTCWPDQK